MLIERIDPGTDSGEFRSLYEVYARASRHDDPEVPPLSASQFHGWWTYGEAGEPLEIRMARTVKHGEIVGGCNLVLFDKDNTHAAMVKLFVDPGQRRRGYGRALLDHAVERARMAGRTLLIGGTRDGSAGSAFAAACGAEPGLTEPKRVLDLEQADRNTHARLLDEARSAAHGYTVLRWSGPAPEEHLDGVAGLARQMSDAPVDDLDLGDEYWDPKLIRAAERGGELRGERWYQMVVRHDRSRQLVGLTEISLSDERPDWGNQKATVVLPAHRGHRLGLFLKLSMLDWLAEQEPRLRTIVTGNAATNAHMLRINELLGFRHQRDHTDWQLHIAD